ncbi:MAG: L,D-transpeptidase [Polyangiaceae bacterium]
MAAPPAPFPKQRPSRVFSSLRSRIAFLALSATVALVLSSARSVRAEGEKATRILVRKRAHEMVVFAGDVPLHTWRVAIGPGGVGPKHIEGDKVTPVGRYHVIAKSPSVWGTFMRLDYPNAEDRLRFARLKREGKLPRNATIGGDIGIHGAPQEREYKKGHKESDWTLGCIALDDDEIRELARRVPLGTVVDIED